LLADATNAQLFLTNLALTNTGNYAAVASSGPPRTTSAPAALVVLSATNITATIQHVRHVLITEGFIRFQVTGILRIESIRAAESSQASVDAI
jgi:hypothetical protein